MASGFRWPIASITRCRRLPQDATSLHIFARAPAKRQRRSRSTPPGQYAASMASAALRASAVELGRVGQRRILDLSKRLETMRGLRWRADADAQMTFSGTGCLISAFSGPRQPGMGVDEQQFRHSRE